MADPTNAWREEAEEEEEEELDEVSFKAQKDAVLFAIQISESMLTPPPSSDSKKASVESPAVAAIKCAHHIMQQRIISNPKDMMGILLFGTEESRFYDADGELGTSTTYPHCYLMSDLNVPSADDVKMLRNITEDEEEAARVLVPAEESVSLSDLLWCANQIFTTKAPNFGSRRLFLITDNDNPYASDKTTRSKASIRAKDLYDLGVIIELFAISHSGHEFDRTKFFDDVIYRDATIPEENSLSTANLESSGKDGISLLNNLISDVNSKQVAKRTLFADLPFEIGPGFQITVKGYNILQKLAPARSCYIWLDDEKAQIVTGESTRMAEETTRTVEKAEIKKAYKFGGEQVLFTPDELKELRNFGPPGLRIIGFKPQSMLPTWASMHKSTFIYPSEGDYVGSTRVFTALWQKLLKDTKMAVAWYIARVRSSPQLVAILPSTERFDQKTGSQIVPAGLWLHPLPWADDIRHPPEALNPPIVSPDVLVDEMRVIIQQLQLPGGLYNPENYPNPTLQWHYQILQAIALEEEVPDDSLEAKKRFDKTTPKYRQIDKRAGEYALKWGATLEEQLAVYQKTKGTGPVRMERGVPAKMESKRKLEDEAEEPQHKKARGAVASDMSTEVLRELAQEGQLAKYKVQELKSWLLSKGLDGQGKKGDLIDRVEQYFEKH